MKLAFAVALSALALMGACQMEDAPIPPATQNAGDDTPPSFREPPNLPPNLSAPTGVAPADACGAQALQNLLGQAVPDPFPATGRLRILAQGEPMTMDFLADRLNVITDGATPPRILAIRCG